MLKEADIQTLKLKINKAHRIVIIPHHNPDGDAIGACLGFSGVLKKHNKQVEVVSPSAFPEFLEWMTGASDVVNFEKDKAKARSLVDEADLLFFMDFNGLSRLRNMASVVEKSSGYRVMIDHHPEPDAIANLLFSETSVSSTCELVFELIDRLGWKNQMDKELAECIYSGIMTDTGSLSYNSGRPETYHVVAELVSKGIDKDRVHNLVFHSNSFNRMKLLGHALGAKMTLVANAPAAYISLSSQELDEYAFRPGDTEGFVNYPLWIEGITISALFMENKDLVKASFRSTGDFPVNTFSETYFQGGGHVNAAGGEFQGTLDAAIALFKRKLPLFFEAWKKQSH